MTDTELADRVRAAVATYNAAVEDAVAKIEAARKIGLDAVIAARGAGLMVGGDEVPGLAPGFHRTVHIDFMNVPLVRREIYA